MLLEMAELMSQPSLLTQYQQQRYQQYQQRFSYEPKNHIKRQAWKMGFFVTRILAYATVLRLYPWRRFTVFYGNPRRCGPAR